MKDIPSHMIAETRERLESVPGRLIFGVTRSTPGAFLPALQSAGILHVGVTSITQARRVRDMAPQVQIIWTLGNATAASITRAYRSLKIRQFRVSRPEELSLLLNTVGPAEDLTIIIQLPVRSDAPRLAADASRELAEMMKTARAAADVLGLGYDAGYQPVRPEFHVTKMEELRHLIVSAAVTIDLIDLCGGGPTASLAKRGPALSAFFSEIAKAFESLPISYSAELWLQPDAGFFDQALLPGWRGEVDEEPISPRRRQTFFISYSVEQEPIAKEILDVIEGRGHRAIVQFRDFPQSSFVRSMREGIEKADRFVAVQSKRYWTSDHCQAEWDAAYARDPGGRKRFIVPFLAEPTALPPIASELVYKSLVGLEKHQRRKAIGAWIDYTPKARSRTQLRSALARQASPDVRMRDAQIDAGPNSRLDRPLVDEDLAELPANLRAIIDTLLDALPRNAPPIIKSCLGGYRQHLIERGTQPILGTVIPFAEAIEAQSTADAGQWDAGLETLFQHFFRRHQLLIAHFPLNPERELLFKETPIDEVKASGAHIVEPIALVGEAVAQLREAGLTTADFDNAERAHQEFSRDIASLPMPQGSDDTSITPKRRFLLGTIGFYERMLAALGGVASIGGLASVPSVQASVAAAIAALRRAIDALLRLVV